ncbi:MAG TPA: chemotaxis protein CheB [Steroidobacteraceae bacterium]
MAESDVTDGPATAPSAPSDDVSAPVDFTPRAKLPFAVVGIGASAGGVEALRQFFSATSAASGMAYVVIQHLSPDHESFMAEILGRFASIPVSQIQDGMRIEPDHAYVIRPGHTITLKDGCLHLGEPTERPGHRRPVDDFFRSLAQEQKEKAIAVVLSGMGTNGTAGAQAIKASGGLCIAQDPDSCEFPGMPRSLIHAGYADQVLPAQDIPGLLLRFVQQPYLELDPKGRTRAAQELERHRQHLTEILSLVRGRTGHDFAPYKPSTVLRRIQRRMGLVGIPELDAYVGFVREHTGEAESLANDLMINVTGFFRDAGAWEALRVSVIRPLVEQHASDDPIRAWVTACASGEEAYTLAMVIAEESARARKRIDVKIFATDTADRSLALARSGVYPGGIEADFPPERLERFFDKDEHTYRIKKELREQVVFASQDLLRDPPFSRVDLATCRNLLIYLEPEAQRKALNLLHFALRDSGYLLLGNAETLGDADEIFEVVSKRWRIYRRVGSTQHRFADLTPIRSPERRARPNIPAPVTLPRPSATVAIQTALLAEFGPPTAVVDANERIVYFHGNPEPYLTQPAGEPTQNLLELVRTPLRSAVRNVLRRAEAEKRAITIEETLPGHEGVIQVTAAPFRPASAPEHFRVSFESRPSQTGSSVSAPAQVPVRSGPDDALEEEARTLRRELQTSVEAFEATNEELKASNEEVVSINEELQSANEELETGKEELQALNEELTTVNSQLQSKLLELEAMTNDLDNLLSSTDIAVVFLDPHLKIRRYTPAINDLLTLIPADIGRPLEDFAQKFTDSSLIADAREVMARLIPRESDVRSHSDRWYLRRALPYRTDDNHIDGVVITFVDITALKRAEHAIIAAQARLQTVIEQMPAAVLMAESPSGALVLANRQAAELFNQPYPLPFIGQNWVATYSAFQGFHPDGFLYEPREWPLSRALATGEMVRDEELDFVRADGSRGTVSMSTSPIRDDAGQIIAVVAAFWDITERKQGQAALSESERRFRLLVESAKDYAIFMLDRTGSVISWNRGAERVTGFNEEEILGQSGSLLFTPEDRAVGIPEQELRRAADAGSSTDERWHVRKDQTRFWASGVTSAARDSQGRLDGFVKVMRDQTERKATDARLHEALQSAQLLRSRAEGANRAKDEFISTVSHELRTPLNTIRLWSRILVTGKVQGQEVIEGGKVIDRAALAQQQLIDDLLDVSRMATGHLRLALRDTLLTPAIEGAIDAVRSLAEARKINLVARLPSDVGIVRVDPDRIQQVVWNLLTNAVKFTQEGGRIEVGVRRVDGTVEIEVTDNGVGISAEFLPHVFDRFRQADSSAQRQFAGLGLGLAIAKQLVELHGGTISARSDGEKRGATFIVYLPLEERYRITEFAETGGGSPGAVDLRGVEVLLVEDDAMSREATQRLLEEAGAQVRAVNSASAAHEAFEISRPQIIVADVGMPHENGYALLTRLRQLESDSRSDRVPAVAVTAFARDEDRQRALASGFDEHLSKPVDPERLIAVIAQLAGANPQPPKGFRAGG